MAKLVVQHVSKIYTTGKERREVEALAGINLEVNEGEFFSLVGPSGCGKSTLLYIIGGFIPPSEGKILVDGREVSSPGVDRGIVFQEFALFPVEDGHSEYPLWPRAEKDWKRREAGDRTQVR